MEYWIEYSDRVMWLIHSWNTWNLITEAICMPLRLFVLSFECHDVCDTDPRGFIVADPETNLDAHIGSDYIIYINDWDQQLYQGMSKKGIFPEGSIFEDALKMHVNQGYIVLLKTINIFGRADPKAQQA